MTIAKLKYLVANGDLVTWRPEISRPGITGILFKDINCLSM
jgi:hypothetical protein